VRQILHPGPVAAERATVVAGAPVPLRFVLEPGETVDQAIARGMAAAGCRGGFVAFNGGRCEPFRYVMPAASPDADHVAWYSETFEPAGPVDVTSACAIVGERDGGPFLHCHGIWDTAEGRRMGHMLAPVTTVAEPIEVRGIGFREATFRGMPDAETNFTLFEPVRTAEAAPAPAGRRAWLAKVRPNEDISLAVEAICARQGIAQARIHGIGSLNGVRFVDGTRVESHATEVLISRGIVEGTGDGLRARLAIDVVDMEGAVFSGELVHGDNPVLITFELVIEEIGA
jgi:predicted DNA-binding protein with PD1-like motif